MARSLEVMPRTRDPCESPHVPAFALGKTFDGGVLESLDVEPSGEIRLSGWSRDPDAVPNVLALARSLPVPILDFGCVSGALVRALLGEGIEAEGIELRRPEIVASLKADVLPFVKLHEGGFPLPYRDGQFGAVVCSEVIEHIPDWSIALKEIARVARRSLITVPDMSAIPALFPHHVVPWHLLESTHLNFFTQTSLRQALSPLFSRVRYLRIGEFKVNGTRVFTSLVADCER